MLTLILLGFGYLVLLFVFKRYPNEQELKARFGNEIPEGGTITVDSTQADIGYFGITIRHRDKPPQAFHYETDRRWVWPWSSYRWER